MNPEFISSLIFSGSVGYVYSGSVGAATGLAIISGLSVVNGIIDIWKNR